MARYIDADFVSDGLREVLHRPKSEFPDDFEQAIKCLVYAISILKFAPTADVATVVHAHWIVNPKYSIVCNCSNCGVGVRGSIGEHYCFNCGAKMDGEAEADEL